MGEHTRYETQAEAAAAALRMSGLDRPARPARLLRLRQPVTASAQRSPAAHDAANLATASTASLGALAGACRKHPED